MDTYVLLKYAGFVQNPEEARIRKILFEVWDPLEVGSNPNLSGEYDSFVGEILLKVKARCPASVLEDHLAKLEKDLGVPGSSDSREQAALQLLSEQ
jgi:hypothetical protein